MEKGECGRSRRRCRLGQDDSFFRGFLVSDGTSQLVSSSSIESRLETE